MPNDPNWKEALRNTYHTVDDQLHAMASSTEMHHDKRVVEATRRAVDALTELGMLCAVALMEAENRRARKIIASNEEVIKRLTHGPTG